MVKPRILFGINSSFAVRHLLSDTLRWAKEMGYETLVAAPPPAVGQPAANMPGVEYFPLPIEREIAPWSDVRALWQLWRLVRATRPDISDMSTPKMGLIGGLACWLAGVPKRIYMLRGLRYETTRSWKRFLLINCERMACACAHQVICISRERTRNSTSRPLSVTFESRSAWHICE